MAEKNLLIDEACKIISDNLGEYTARMYRKFYAGKSQDIILSSLNQLLTELIGPMGAQKQINKLLLTLKK